MMDHPSGLKVKLGLMFPPMSHVYYYTLGQVICQQAGLRLRYWYNNVSSHVSRLMLIINAFGWGFVAAVYRATCRSVKGNRNTGTFLGNDCKSWAVEMNNNIRLIARVRLVVAKSSFRLAFKYVIPFMMRGVGVLLSLFSLHYHLLFLVNFLVYCYV